MKIFNSSKDEKFITLSKELLTKALPIIKAIKLIPSLRLYIADLKDIEEQNLQEFRKNILQNCIEPVN